MPHVSSTSRYASLDGLRGVAALVVVIHHAMLVSPDFAGAYYDGGVGDSPIRQALTYSPLHVVWAGAEAVVVFFVLSGFVLGMAMRSPRFDWSGYFPSRLVRLYLPVAGAVLLGYLIILLPHDGATSSAWLDRTKGYPLSDVIRDLTLVGGTSGVISPLWTLRWEVLFSLLLPVMAYAARLIPAWLLGVLCVLLSTLGAWQDVASLQYLPIFGVGIALSKEWRRIAALTERLSPRAAALAWPVALVAAVLLLTSYWWLVPVLVYSAANAIGQFLILVGASLLLVVCVQWAPLHRVLSGRAVAWLGAISFSLYLVHEPVLILIANLSDSARVTFLVGTPLAIGVAWFFWIVVERPAHRVSRAVRERAGARRRVALSDVGRAHTPERETVGAGR